MATEERKYLGQSGVERLITSMRGEINAGDEAQASALAEHKEDTTLHVTAEEKEVLLSAVDHVHEHSNKEVLDQISSIVDIYTQPDEPVNPTDNSIWFNTSNDGAPSILVFKDGQWETSSDGQSQKQANWNQTDASQADYIRNRPFGFMPDIFGDSNVAFSQGEHSSTVYMGNIDTSFGGEIKTGDAITIIWDSVSYKCVAKNSAITEWVSCQNTIGNPQLAADYFASPVAVEDSGEPFCFIPPLGWVFARSRLATHSFQIQKEDRYQKIDVKYLPDEALLSPVQPDWNEEDSTSFAFIQNKPEFATVEYVDNKFGEGSVDQVQANWDQTDDTAVDFIKNKPEIPDVSGFASVEYVDEQIASIGATGDGHEHANKDVLDQIYSIVDIYMSEEEAADAPDGSLLIDLDAGGIGGAGVAAGAGLPSVDTDDNGKILQVVDGVWRLVDIADSAVKTYVDEYIGSALDGDY